MYDQTITTYVRNSFSLFYQRVEKFIAFVTVLRFFMYYRIIFLFFLILYCQYNEAPNVLVNVDRFYDS